MNSLFCRYEKSLKTSVLLGNLWILSLLVLWVTGCNKLASGTAEGFGGDDFYRDLLNDVRVGVLESELKSILTAPANENFCNYQQYCVNAPNELCSLAPQLSSAEQTECSNFLRLIAGDALARVQADDVTIETTSSPIIVDGHEMLAHTALAPTGKIWVNSKAVQDLGYERNELSVLLTHEMLHKTAVAGSYLDDQDVYGVFNGAKRVTDLFTAVGFAVAFRKLYHYSVQVDGVFPASSIMTLGLRSFSGVGSVPKIADSSGLRTGDSFTWSFLLQVLGPQKDLSRVNNALFSKQNETGSISYFCDMRNHTDWFVPGRIECGNRDANGLFVNSLISNVRVDDGRVHHILFVKSGAQFKLIIDGKEDVSYTPLFPPTSTSNNAPVWLGERPGAAKFNGNLGVLHLWKTVFSPGQNCQLQSLLVQLFPLLDFAKKNVSCDR